MTTMWGALVVTDQHGGPGAQLRDRKGPGRLWRATLADHGVQGADGGGALLCPELCHLPGALFGVVRGACRGGGCGTRVDTHRPALLGVRSRGARDLGNRRTGLSHMPHVHGRTACLPLGTPGGGGVDVCTGRDSPGHSPCAVWDAAARRTVGNLSGVGRMARGRGPPRQAYGAAPPYAAPATRSQISLTKNTASTTSMMGRVTLTPLPMKKLVPIQAPTILKRPAVRPRGSQTLP